MATLDPDWSKVPVVPNDLSTKPEAGGGQTEEGGGTGPLVKHFLPLSIIYPFLRGKKKKNGNHEPSDRLVII